MRLALSSLSLAALVAAAISPPLGAQDPAPVATLEISPPQSLAIGDLAVVAVDPSSNVQDPQFAVVPAPANPADVRIGRDERGNPCAYLVAGADAKGELVYTVVVAANLNGGTIVATTTVTFGAAPQPPTPQPTPTPTPPAAKSLWLISIYDTAAPDPQTAALAADSAFWYSLSQSGQQFRTFDAADPEAAPFVAAAAKLGISTPCLLYMDADSHKVLRVDPLPRTEAQIQADVAALTGRTSDDR